MRLNSLSLQKKFSIKWRHLQASASILRGVRRPRVLGNDDPGSAPVEFADDPVDVEGLVRDQAAERGGADQRRHADRVMALTGQKFETHKVSQRIGERDDPGRDPAARGAYGLALSPPFAPCPWRWTLTMAPSIIATSMSGSSDTAPPTRRLRHGAEDPFENIELHPMAEPLEGRVPVPEVLRQGATERRCARSRAPLPETIAHRRPFDPDRTSCPGNAAPSSPTARPSGSFSSSTAPRFGSLKQTSASLEIPNLNKP